jgi:hypothetical protein
MDEPPKPRRRRSRKRIALHVCSMLGAALQTAWIELPDAWKQQMPKDALPLATVAIFFILAIAHLMAAAE